MSQFNSNQQFHTGASDHLSQRIPPLRHIIERDHVSISNQHPAAPCPRLAAQNSYGSATFGDQANAILGDVNIHAPNLAFVQHAAPIDQKKLLLRSLYFEQMNSRKAQIDARASSPEYVAWVWKTDFVTWLEGPDPFFWITGRPGSGKSTLMTHVSSSSRTKNALEKGGRAWKIVCFFFDFRAGTSMANSIEGLVRSLLYQVVKQIPQVAAVLDHDEFTGSMAAWTLHKCLDALREATESCSYSICAFIDGLDEFEGSYARLIEVMHTIKENVSGLKLCLASRPYLAFLEGFGKFSTLVMQEHNHESIDLYTSAQWSSHRIDHKANLPQELCKRIREKANGVFLWARLAVDELLIDYLAQKPLPELYAQLEAMPAEVEEMYQRSLERMSEAHQQEAAAVLYVILQTNGELSIDKLYATISAMRDWGQISQAILPIDCDADNSRRVFAILGDLTDQTPSKLYESHGYKNHDAGSIPPRLVIENGAIKCRRGRAQCVVLTHETLRAFLVGSSWLKSKIGERYNFSQGSGYRFWADMYLTAISSRMLSGSRNLILEQSICDATKTYTHEATVMVQKATHNINLDCQFHEETLIAILQIWPNWSALLLFAVQELLDQLSNIGGDCVRLAGRIVPLIRSSFFTLHTAVCVFERCMEDAIHHWGNDVLRQLQGCVCHLFFSKAISGSVSCGVSLKYAISAMISHDLDMLAPFLAFCDDECWVQKQQIFDIAWDTFATRLHRECELHPTDSLQWLLDKDCKFEGRHLCTLCKYYTSSEVTEWQEFLAKNLSPDSLGHAADCERRGLSKDIRDHLPDWEEAASFDLMHAVVSTLGNCGISCAEFMNLTGENSVTQELQDNFKRPRFKMVTGGVIAKHVQLLLDAGGDPYFRGRSGNACEVAATVLDGVRNDPEFTMEDIQEVKDVVEILRGYAERNPVPASRPKAYKTPPSNQQ